jgi:hypothetical protein
MRLACPVLLLLLGVGVGAGGCAGAPPPVPVFAAAPPVADRVPVRARPLRPLPPQHPSCSAAALDSALHAQWLIAATFAEGPRGVELPVFGCNRGFRAL